jgi:hypothetical protein
MLFPPQLPLPTPQYPTVPHSTLGLYVYAAAGFAVGINLGAYIKCSPTSRLLAPPPPALRDPACPDWF